MSYCSPYAYESTDLNLRICMFEEKLCKGFFKRLSSSFSHFLRTLSAVVSKDMSFKIRVSVEIPDEETPLEAVFGLSL